ncbi:hypothetical protein ADIAL_0966 [Alkalibacterium sp. AK22]|uniref:YrhK family protein n=1 Tax=Alkalibacterium sp. AK22 TaxID=1229520 RepID=UPI000446DD30|nr:YrhK family protein [Alkalibacterium sp. AK22]EXJ23529.1 hypothetical protein ADIAL_0966 [Alkalibacterium sp. AK22]
MPEIEKKQHDLTPGKDEDIIIKAGGFRVYFQNYYTIISLGNDLLTGMLYLVGSLLATFTEMETAPMYLYIFASLFLLMRPILKIIHSVFLYTEDQYQEEILGKIANNQESDQKAAKGNENIDIKSEDKESCEEIRKYENERAAEQENESEKEYNEGYYGN